MKLEEIPFEVNKQTLRYLSELVDFCNGFPTDEKGVVYTIETYTGTEKPTYRSEENNARFWEYLKETEVAIYEKPKQFVAVEYEDVGGVPLMYPKTLVIKVLVPEQLQGLADTAQQTNAVDSSKARVEFKNGVLSYKNVVHNFQARGGKNIALEVFNAIWADKKVIVSGKTIKAGKTWKPLLLGNKIDRIFDRSLNSYNRPALKDMIKLLGQTERNLKDKEIPIRIVRTPEIQIVLEYKS